MKTKHTPGPWVVEGRAVYALNEKGANRFYASVQDAKTDESELEANARLIAAAPELLELLVRVVDHPTYELEMGDRKEIRAAIAKATAQ